jgi:acetyl-CoA decarbonylase/synthase complex subunit gamma
MDDSLHFLPLAQQVPEDVGRLQLPSLNQPFTRKAYSTAIGDVPRVDKTITWNDRLGRWLARWNIGRMRFQVEPGLYALGRPDRTSPVLVTANYKMSFDELRRHLAGRNCWILVLDTRGINVWCAAGKGTFGTLEMLDRIVASRLDKVVEHRRLIVPQLGAPGLAAHEIRKHSGFRVEYGPVLARDLPTFLDNGCRADPAMRIKDFPFHERLVLVPVELMQALLQIGLPVILSLLLLSGFSGGIPYARAMIQHGVPAALAVLTGILAGTVLTPLLLPWTPGRAFSWKGFMNGVFLFTLVFGSLKSLAVLPEIVAPELLSLLLLSTAAASWFGMAFTGASTYTSLNGVRKEMLRAIPLQFLGAAAGILLWVYSLFFAHP